MIITVVCEKCLNSDKDPNIEIDFKDQSIYYICPKCKNENSIILKIESRPYPKSRGMSK